MLDGQEGTAWVPGLYVGSGAKSGHVALGRMTSFDYPTDGFRRGYGMRDFALQDGDGMVAMIGIAGCRRIELGRRRDDSFVGGLKRLFGG